jgi:hypothetical protein
MSANALVAAAVAAAIGAAAGVAIGYIVFDSSVTMIKLSFGEYVGRNDAILWGILGAIVAAGLSLLHK